MKLLSACAAALLATQAWSASITHRLNGGLTLTEHPDAAKRDLLQQRVTWDAKSLFIDGERLMMFSGEVHPFRLPVPSLWLDIFQKIKALGFNGVSFYVDWALLEGKPGDYRADGIFALEPFFDAAKEAGIYLLARPGPYINAEASGGGFPGWLQRVNGTLRTDDPAYLKSTDNYIAHVGRTIANGQITNGGPVILYQPENEYSGACCGVDFPDPDYFQYVIDQAHNAGIIVPVISNDAGTSGYNAPGTGKGSVDIYGHDDYPLGFDCANPNVWPEGNLPTDFRTQHLQDSPTTPYSIIEFQAGAFDPWGGPGFDNCAALVNHEYERVFYKNDFSFQVAILNLYMTFGGTNWGNLGHPGGYSSYDYGSPITESRNVTREKYSELKLEGNFIKVSPSYLTASPGNLTNSEYTDTTDLTVTPLKGDADSASYYVLRHSNYASRASTNYKLKVPSSTGDLTLPQMGGTLSLHGRDSKIHVVDYDVAGTKLLYSTAEVFTWKKFDDKKVLVLYGGPNEHHEFAVSHDGSSKAKFSMIEGPESGFAARDIQRATVISWDVSPKRRIVEVEDLTVILLDRNSAYNYWVPELPERGSSPGLPTQEKTARSIIVNAGYLVRTAFTRGRNLHITADFNATTPVEVIGAPSFAKHLFINDERVRHAVNKHGFWTTKVDYTAPGIRLPSLKDLDWKYVDSLPEIQSEYDDSAWTVADRPVTNNTLRPLDTPTSLYSSDYGYHTGYLIYRGHFDATGDETTFSVHTQGGSAYGHSVWLGETHLGSFQGTAAQSDFKATYKVPNLAKGRSYVLTVLIDNMGLNEDWTVGTDDMKHPRGILNYDLSGSDASAITWKLTGNLGGEDYKDKVRGPLNEGGLYIERQGFHQPQPPSKHWRPTSPLHGLDKAGVAFYSAKFDLDIPNGWDVPLFFNFANNTSPPVAYRAQLYINGYQYGKYTNNIGPQTSYPVPEGILNYRGTNWIGLSLWAMQDDGAKLDGFELVNTTPVKTGMQEVKPVSQPKYSKRNGAY